VQSPAAGVGGCKSTIAMQHIEPIALLCRGCTVNAVADFLVSAPWEFLRPVSRSIAALE
jgi:hypothetical protein